MNTLALVHGWGATAAVWRPLKERFTPKLQVLAPTLPGWRADWLAGWLATLPLADTLAVGWSLGGMLLLEALAAFGLKPAGAVLVAVPAVFCRRPDFPHGQPPAAVRAMRQGVKRDAGPVLGDFARRCLAPGEEAFGPAVRELFPDGQEADFLADGLDYLLRGDLRPLLPRIFTPVTLVQGGADPVVPPEQARFLKERLPDARLTTLPGAGHLPFITQMARFNEIVIEVVGESRGNAVPPPSPVTTLKP